MTVAAWASSVAEWDTRRLRYQLKARAVTADTASAMPTDMAVAFSKARWYGWSPALPGRTAASMSCWNIGGPTSAATAVVVAKLATITTELAASNRVLMPR